MSANFSASMMLADLDYIAPSQQCIKPMMIMETKLKKANAQSGGGLLLSHQEDTSTFNKEEAMKISLADCLACSGCVTTAETMLVQSQSKEEILSVLRSRDPGFTPPAPATAAAATSSSSAAVAELQQKMNNNNILNAEQIQTLVRNARPFGVFAVSISDQSAASIAAATHCDMMSAFRKVSGFFRSVLGATHVVDTRWAQQVVLDETAREFIRRLRDEPQNLPLLVSSCPGWVCYCEKTKPKLLPFMSPVMSAQGIIGRFVKTVVNSSASPCAPEDKYHISVQPCFDKKLEAVRPEFADPTSYSRETDCVLSSHELLEWMKEVDATLPWDAPLDSTLEPLREAVVSASSTTCCRVDGDGASSSSATLCEAATLEGSGGFHQHVMRYTARTLLQQQQQQTSPVLCTPPFPLDAIAYQTKRNNNNRVATNAQLVHPTTGRQLVFGIAYGFQTIQNVVRQFGKASAPQYSFIEVMACPEGCLNGGGQVRAPDPLQHRDTLAAVNRTFETFQQENCQECRVVEADASSQEAQLKVARKEESSTAASRGELEGSIFTSRSVYELMLKAAPGTLEASKGLWTIFHNREEEMKQASEVNLAALKW